MKTIDIEDLPGLTDQEIADAIESGQLTDWAIWYLETWRNATPEFKDDMLRLFRDVTRGTTIPKDADLEELVPELKAKYAAERAAGIPPTG